MTAESQQSAPGCAEIRVVIVDDHQVVLEGLKKYVSYGEGLRVVGEARNGSEAVAACDEIKPDVVLMDMVMPGMDGAEATALIKQAHPEVQVVALTSYVDDDLVKRAMVAGAISYLLKDASPEYVLAAIRDAAAGRGTVDSAAMAVLLERQRSETIGHDLSERDRAVLVLLAKGLTNEEIGQRLHVSEGTIRQCVGSILVKLGAANRTNAVMIAIQHGLI
jgi:NarL family two-component system response regulator LiaR